MKTTLYVLLLTAQVNLIMGQQNLVLNHSFEQNTGCPTIASPSLSLVNDWSNPSAFPSPDYLHSCGVGHYNIPNSPIGYQLPFSGEAYTGIFTCIPPGGSAYREYIQGSLTTPMIAGETYHVSFWVSLAEGSTYSCNHMGIYFSQNQVFYNAPSLPTTLPLIPHYENTTLQLDDIHNWIEIEFDYQATGDESYFIIGNFRPDSLTVAHNMPVPSPFNGSPGAYYFIDEVSIEMQPQVTTINQLNHPLKFDVFPSPAHNKVFIETHLSQDQEVSFKIYNTKGVVVKSLFQHSMQPATIELDVSDLPIGIYFVRAQVGNHIHSKKLVIVRS